LHAVGHWSFWLQQKVTDTGVALMEALRNRFDTAILENSF